MTKVENLGICQYQVLPCEFYEVFCGKSSLSDGNDCEICSDMAAFLLETVILEVKRNKSTERSSK